MGNFSFNRTINLSEEGKRLLAVTVFEATNSIFSITDEKKRFPIFTTGDWIPEGSEGLNNKLGKLLDL